MIGLARGGAAATALVLALAACGAPEPPPPLPTSSAASPVDAAEARPRPARPITDAVTTVRSVPVDGRDRSFRLRLSPGPAEDDGWPLLLALHGKGGSALEMEEHSGLNEAADAAGVAVAYLEGVDQGWGAAPRPTELRPDPNADVAYTRAVLDQLLDDARINPDRVFVVGFSEGAIMALRLAAEHPDWFAAAASVAGQLPAPPAEVRPSGPIPLLSIYGDADPLRPIEGLTSQPEGTPPIGREPPRPTVSTADTVDAFCRAGGADEQHHEEPPLTAPPDGTSLTRATCVNPDTGLEVVSIVVRGGGHTWPGGTFPNPARTVGVTSRQISAAETVLDFLVTSRG